MCTLFANAGSRTRYETHAKQLSVVNAATLCTEAMMIAITNPEYWSNVFSRSQQKTQKTIDDVSTDQTVARIVGNRNPPMNRNNNALVQKYKQIPRFRSVISVISYGVASVGWRVGFFSKKNEYRSVSMPKFYKGMQHDKRNKFLLKKKSAGQYQELDDHPLLDVLDCGNAKQSGMDVRSLTTSYIDVIGEAYWYIEGWETNRPVRLWPISPLNVEEIPTMLNPAWKIRNIANRIPEKAIVQFVEPDLQNPYGRGSSLGFSLSDELDTSQYVAHMLKSTFYNEGRPAGIVSLEGHGPAGLKESSIRRFEREWILDHQGPGSYNKMKFTNAKVNFQKISQEIGSLQTLPLRDELRNLFQQVYGVPPEKIGIIENSNRATIDAAEYLFSVGVLIPRLERMRVLIQNKIAPMFDENLVVEYDNPIPENNEFQLAVMKARPQAYTNNDFRRLSGHDDDPDYGDDRYVPVNMIPADGNPASDTNDDDILDDLK